MNQRKSGKAREASNLRKEYSYDTYVNSLGYLASQWRNSTYENTYYHVGSGKADTKKTHDVRPQKNTYIFSNADRDISNAARKNKTSGRTHE